MMSMPHKWKISKYAWWDFELCKWQVPLFSSDPASKLFLIIKNSQFMLESENTVLESFCLVQKQKTTRIHVKDDTMAVVIKYGEGFRKFKILFDSSKDSKEATQILSKYVKIGGESSSGKTNNEQQTPNQVTLPHLLEQLMSSPHPQIPAPASIPEDFPLESAIQLCLLDPGFPSLVHRIETILSQTLNPTSNTRNQM